MNRAGGQHILRLATDERVTRRGTKINTRGALVRVSHNLVFEPNRARALRPNGGFRKRFGGKYGLFFTTERRRDEFLKIKTSATERFRRVSLQPVPSVTTKRCRTTIKFVQPADVYVYPPSGAAVRDVKLGMA